LRRQLKINHIVTSLILVLIATSSLLIAPAALGCGAGDSNEALCKWERCRHPYYPYFPYFPCFPNFSITAFPKSLTAEQGGFNSSTIIVISLNGFNKPVNLTAAILPPNPDVTLTLSPPQVTPPKNDYAVSTLTVEAAKNAEVGNYTITVTATSRCLKHSVEISLEILPAAPPPPIFDFDISAYPPSLNIQQGSSNASIITITSLSAASQPVDLVVTLELISGISATLNPSRVIPPPNSFAISLLTVEANATAPLGDYTITVTGRSGTLQRSVNITLTVIAPTVLPIPDFYVAAFPPSLTIQAGDSDTATIAIISLRDFNKTVNLKATSEPSEGITLSLNPSEVTPQPNYFATSTLTVEVNLTATLGDYKITVTGTSDSLEHNVAIPLVVKSPPLPQLPDFSLAASPASLKVQQGGLGASSIIVTSLKGFSQPVDMEATSVAGVNLALDPSEVTPSPNGFASSTLTVSVSAATSLGEYEINVTGTSGNLEHETKILLTVVAEKTPPQIVGVLGPLKNPAYNESVTVFAFVTDVGSGVNEVILSYSGGGAWKNVTMTLENGPYIESIPAFPYSTEVSYRVYASDKAGNWAAPSSVYSYMVVDPYPPEIGAPSWSPEKPAANENITISVNVTEPPYSSGVKEVTLQYMNATVNEWLSVPMSFKNGNWVANITHQSDTLVTFFIEASDNAGNTAKSAELQFTVAAPPGVPLAWILLAIVAIGAVTGGGIYYWRRRRKKSRGTVA
jgi:hypothetical protein